MDRSSAKERDQRSSSSSRCYHVHRKQTKILLVAQFNQNASTAAPTTRSSRHGSRRELPSIRQTNKIFFDSGPRDQALQASDIRTNGGSCSDSTQCVRSLQFVSMAKANRHDLRAPPQIFRSTPSPVPELRVSRELRMSPFNALILRGAHLCCSRNSVSWAFWWPLWPHWPTPISRVDNSFYQLGEAPRRQRTSILQLKSSPMRSLSMCMEFPVRCGRNPMAAGS
jgi:hypothetical protein